MTPGQIVITLVVLLVVLPASGVVLVMYFRPITRGVWWFCVHVGTFIGREIADVVRILGAVLTSLVLAPIAGMNLILGRPSSASHYSRAILSELVAAVGCVYRVVVGNPARLLGVQRFTQGFEARMPHAIAHDSDAAVLARKRAAGAKLGQFDGYTIVGTLPGGGSGAKLYVAEPGRRKLAAFERDGHRDVTKVVVKSFSLNEGSTLPQIVRENRALPAAQRMGLILEHELTEEKFYYVTRYVPGESLVVVTQRLHALGGGDSTGLGNTERLKEALGYASDIVRTLSRYHGGGLWHKDVKPDNIIVHNGRAELVDFGLVTPLRSSMTLTTHGTEYFRDPEMVRMALRGVKVHEVDGAKFDIYAAGAVLYSMVENSFPAHGGLSQIGKKCPEALRWIVRRAMTDYDRRYETAAVMLADIERVMTADDPFALRLADLPSVSQDAERGVEPSSRVLPIPEPDMEEIGAPRVGSPVEAMEQPEFPAVAAVSADAAPELPAPRAALGPAGELPVFRVVNWWSGRYSLEPAALGAVPGFDTAEALADERERAKAFRKGVPANIRERRRRAAAAPWGRAHGLSRGAKIAIGVAVLALAANVLAFSRRGPAQTQFEKAVSAVRNTLGLGAREASGGPSKGSVLILWEGNGLDAASHTQMKERLERLEQAGFEIVGTTTPAENSAKATEEAEEILDLKNHLGSLAFHTDQAAQAIRSWLDEHKHALIVWIRPDAERHADPWIVAKPGLEADTVRAATHVMTGPASRG